MEVLYWILVFLVMYTYFIYPVALAVLSKIRTSYIAKDKDHYPSVSMVISAYNEEKVLDDKIKNCLDMDYPRHKFEVLIGSDGSDDGTNEIIKSYENTNIKGYLFKRRRGKINVLNDLIPNASGNIIVLSDANTMYNKDAVKMLVRNFKEDKVGVVCGELKLINPNDNEGGSGEGLYWRYEKKIKKMESAVCSTLGANGGIYAIRKELFDPLPSNIIVDDFVISMNIIDKGYRCVYESDAVAKEYTSLSMQDEFKRKVRIAAGGYQSIFLVKDLLNPFRGLISFELWSHKILRWLSPLFLIIIFITNILLFKAPFYNILMYLQIVFYTLAALGCILSKRNVNIGKLYIPYYFTAVNWAFILGFIKFIFNKQQAKWETIER